MAKNRKTQKSTVMISVIVLWFIALIISIIGLSLDIVCHNDKRNILHDVSNIFYEIGILQIILNFHTVIGFVLLTVGMLGVVILYKYASLSVLIFFAVLYLFTIWVLVKNKKKSN